MKMMTCSLIDHFLHQFKSHQLGGASLVQYGLGYMEIFFSLLFHALYLKINSVGFVSDESSINKYTNHYTISWYKGKVPLFFKIYFTCNYVGLEGKYIYEC